MLKEWLFLSKNLINIDTSQYTDEVGYCAYHKCALTQSDISLKHCRHKRNTRKPCRHLTLSNYRPKPVYRNDRCGVKAR